ncbi:MAG: ribosomal protein S18-alanine N-acetyltransferase [Gammaproteobacteria bacterium]|nr:ribosomal protein S18-alanine N-acetyltransferase [Gammaproteobacteria bacterium]
MSVNAMSMSDALRPMQLGDVAAIMDIERRVYPFPWSEGIFRDCVHVGYCCWVLEQGSEIVAYAVMSIGAAEAHILNICVAPEQQGRGIGSQLLLHLLELAGRHQAAAVFLEVRPSNKKAIKLYHALGFQDVGIRKDYYPDHKGRENALILERKL